MQLFLSLPSQYPALFIIQQPVISSKIELSWQGNFEIERGGIKRRKKRSSIIYCYIYIIIYTQTLDFFFPIMLKVSR